MSKIRLCNVGRPGHVFQGIYNCCMIFIEQDIIREYEAGRHHDRLELLSQVESEAQHVLKCPVCKQYSLPLATSKTWLYLVTAFTQAYFCF